MRKIHPSAFQALRSLGARLVFTDVYRDPVASLEVRAQKRGVQLPGYSAHGFGLAVDLDIERTLDLRKINKTGLDELMLRHRWRCFRADHAENKSEAWHYTWSAAGPGAQAVEDAIQGLYGGCFVLNPKQIQVALASLRLYGGAIDGQIGPLSRRGLFLFQCAWELEPTGAAGPDTQRLLAVVTADTTPQPIG